MTSGLSGCFAATTALSVVSSNPVQGNNLCDPVMIVLSRGDTLCPLVVCLESPPRYEARF